MNNTYFQTEKKRIFIPSDCSLSYGNSCVTRERKMNDGTSTSYAIATFVKPSPTTFSLSFAVSPFTWTQDAPYTSIDLRSRLYEYDALTGKNAEFYYGGRSFGSVIVTDFDVAIAVDGSIGLSLLNISLNFKQNVVLLRRRESVKTRLF